MIGGLDFSALLCAVQPESVKKVSQINNIFGSIVSFQNALLAPLAPLGRKLQEKDQQNDWQTNWLNTNNPVSMPHQHLMSDLC